MKFHKKSLTQTQLGLTLLALVALALLVLWQFGPGGLLEGVKKAYQGVKKIVPEISIGAEELKGEKPTLSAAQEAPIKHFAETIKNMLASSKTNCFANYGLLPDLGENGVVLELSEGGIIIKTPDGKQIYSVEKIPDFKPCVIAGKGARKEEKEKYQLGEGTIADNFYNNFLKEGASCLGCDMWNCPAGCTAPYWMSVEQIVIKEKETIIYGGNKGDLEDGGWLYKNNNDYVCFFPTQDLWNGAGGLNDDYVKGEGKNSIKALINKDPTKSC